MKDKRYIGYTRFIVFFVFVVILAGGVVRMTQSGMGCPDWPTCFGRWIPPINESQLPENYESYLDKQDIDHSFNVYHTWIEYINRLLGAILGLLVIIHLIWSVRKFWSRDRIVVLLSMFTVLFTGFVGWLGKVVVDANLSEIKVTLHMLVALIIAILPLGILSRFRDRIRVERFAYYMTILTLCLVLVQIYLGTNVREHIDVVSKALSYEQREIWIGKLGSEFLIHRSFSWLILISSSIIFWKGRESNGLLFLARNQFVLLIVIILLGISMNYLGMPAIAQPFHLLLSSIFFTYLVYMLLNLKIKS